MTMTHTPIQYSIILFFIIIGFILLTKSALILLDNKATKKALLKSLAYGLHWIFIISFMMYCL